MEKPWLSDRRLARLCEFWFGARPRPGHLPGRQHIDPVAIGADLLPYIALLDVTGNMRVRFRLFGTKLLEYAGRDLTGLYADEASADRDYGAYINGLYRNSIAERLPVYSETQYRTASGRAGLTRRLICPLAGDGMAIDMFIATQIFQMDAGPGDPPTYTYAAGFTPGIAVVITD